MLTANQTHSSNNNFESLNKTFVQQKLKQVGISDFKVLTAFRKVPREKFVPLAIRNRSYEDVALPIGLNQTISQPSLVALMTELLELTGEEKVLEIGTGSGYQAALLSHLAKEVYTVERLRPLALRARRVFRNLGLHNIHVFVGNGTLGLAKFQPYDAIVVTAGAKLIPQPLIDQLAECGRMVIPVGSGNETQILKLLVKRHGQISTIDIEPVQFVPLIDKNSWQKSLGKVVES